MVLPSSSSSPNPSSSSPSSSSSKYPNRKPISSGPHPHYPQSNRRSYPHPRSNPRSQAGSHSNSNFNSYSRPFPSSTTNTSSPSTTTASTSSPKSYSSVASSSLPFTPLQPPSAPASILALAPVATTSSNLPQDSSYSRTINPPSSIASSSPAVNITMPTPSPQVKLLTSSGKRILCVAEIRGQLSKLNELAKKYDASCIIHSGNFGFFDSNSISRISLKYVYFIFLVIERIFHNFDLPIFFNFHFNSNINTNIYNS